MRLNPLSAGRSFQTDEAGVKTTGTLVLIPYQQGGLFRPIVNFAMRKACFSLNPLSAGRSFQTVDTANKKEKAPS